MSRGAAAVLAAYTLLAVILVPVFPHFISPNEFSRWVLAASLTEERSVEVSRYAALLGPRFEDLAEREGRFYSNKAPGLALVSLPGYAIGRLVTGTPSRENLRPQLTAMRIAGSTLPVILLAVLLLRLADAYRIDRDRSTSVIAILLFGTPLFAYGLLLFSHALVAAALFGAWALLFGPAISSRRDFSAGVLIGVAVLAEYPAAIPSAVLVASLLFTRSWGRAARVVAGGLPLAAVMAIYHAAAFGSPFTFPTQFDRLPEYRTLAHTAFLGIGLPSPANLARLLFDPGKGLLVFAPVLISGAIGFAQARKQLPRAAWLTLIAVPASLILVHAGYPNWHGGWTVGPRYIVPIIPFLVFAMLFRRGGALESVAAGWSVVAVTLTTLVFPFVPNGFSMPWGTLALPLLRDGMVMPNLAHLVARPLAIAIPFALVATACAIGIRGRALGFAVAGAVLVLFAGFVPYQREEPVLKLQRAYVEEVYFERPGIIDRELPGILQQQPRLARRRDAELLLPPRSWPF